LSASCLRNSHDKRLNLADLAQPVASSVEQFGCEAGPSSAFSAKPPDVRTDGRAPTLEAAKADFEASWRKWLAWAKLSETA
jgi:hypothetical protein